MRKLNLQRLYLKAAELVANGTVEFSCTAVNEASGWSQSVTDYVPTVFYAKTMANRYHILKVSDIYQTVGTGDDECRNFRILLLCMMAAVCKDLDAPKT